MKNVYLYVMNTMADWEVGNITAELNTKRFFKKDALEVSFKTVSFSKETVHTMGGLAILPDLTLEEMKKDKDTMLILPGADVWQKPEHQKVLEIAKCLLNNGSAVCAICGATVALANMGVLDSLVHTSNGKGFLEMFCPAYKGIQFYRDELAVKDKNLITAGSTGGLLMAKLILEYLGVFSDNTLENWYNYFSTGKAEYFFAMMDSLEK